MIGAAEIDASVHYRCIQMWPRGSHCRGWIAAEEIGNIRWSGRFPHALRDCRGAVQVFPLVA
jgi:hypothetical protein